MLEFPTFDISLFCTHAMEPIVPGCMDNHIWMGYYLIMHGLLS